MVLFCIKKINVFNSSLILALKDELIEIKKPASISLISMFLFINIYLAFVLEVGEINSYVKIKELHVKITKDVDYYTIVILTTYWLYLSARLSGWIGLVFRSSFSFLISLNLTCAIFISSVISSGLIASAFETDINEVIGVLKKVKFIPIVIFISIWTCQEYMSRNISKINNEWILALYFFLLFFPLFYLKSVNEGDEKINNNYSYFAAVSKLWQGNLFVYDVLSVIDYFNEKNKLEKLASISRVLPSDIVFENNNSLINKIILVIGESAAKNHYGSYGYPNGTDFFLQNIRKLPDSAYFIKDALSPAPITRESLMRILSLSTAESNEGFFKYWNIIEFAKNAGYQTSWLSNQRRVGIHDTYVGSISNQSDNVIFQQKGDYHLSFSLDSSLLDHFYRLYTDKDKKQFFVMHLIGSHLDYSLGKYDEEDYAASEKSDPTYREYDATVHHTDKILHAIYNHIINQRKFLIIYLPDHGEIVNTGHGLSQLDRRQFEVPVAFIGDPESIARIKKQIELFSRDFSNPFNTTNMFYVLLDQFGYQIDKKRERLAITNGDYFIHTDNQVHLFSELK